MSKLAPRAQSVLDLTDSIVPSAWPMSGMTYLMLRAKKVSCFLRFFGEQVSLCSLDPPNLC
jgi:hypothetical protein